MQSGSRAADLARHVIKAERLGTLNGWRPYLMTEFQKLGYDAKQIKQAIEQERAKG